MHSNHRIKNLMRVKRRILKFKKIQRIKMRVTKLNLKIRKVKFSINKTITRIIRKFN